VGDIRDQLNDRLQELRETATLDANWVRDGAAPTSARYERSSRNLAELRTIEATLATMQLSDAQREVAQAQRDVADAQRAATHSADAHKSKSEEISYWVRRYLTSIAIASGATLLAVLATMVKPDAPRFPSEDVFSAVKLLVSATFLSGIYPLARALVISLDWRGRVGASIGFLNVWGIPVFATILFALGVGVILINTVEWYSARNDSAAPVSRPLDCGTGGRTLPAPTAPS
jgi:glutaminase